MDFLMMGEGMGWAEALFQTKNRAASNRLSRERMPKTKAPRRTNPSRRQNHFPSCLRFSI